MQWRARMHQAERRDTINQTTLTTAAPASRTKTSQDSSPEGWELRIPSAYTRSPNTEEEPTRHRKVFVFMEQHLSLQRVDESCYYMKAGRKRVPTQVPTQFFFSPPVRKQNPYHKRLCQHSQQRWWVVTSGRVALPLNAAEGGCSTSGAKHRDTCPATTFALRFPSRAAPSRPHRQTTRKSSMLFRNDGKSQARKSRRDSPPRWEGSLSALAYGGGHRR